MDGSGAGVVSELRETVSPAPDGRAWLGLNEISISFLSLLEGSDIDPFILAPLN